MTTTLLPRILTLVISYFLGCFLTAEVVCRKLTGKPAKYLVTTGNPGMANVMAHLGFKPGITVLIGDITKTLLAVLITATLFYGDSRDQAFYHFWGTNVNHALGLHTADYGIGIVVVYYAIIGVTIGHNYPFWQKFHGGKGVATSCAGYFLMMPLGGLLSMITGMLIVFKSQYLGLGAAFIPVVYCIFAFFFHGLEAGILAIVLAFLMFIKHWPSVKQIPSGQAERVDVLGAMKKKWFSKKYV